MARLITLVQNQVDDLGKTNVSQGLPSGNAIGQYGFTTGTNGTPGVVVGTLFRRQCHAQYL